MAEQNKITVQAAKPGDAALVLRFIKGLADYENLAHEVVATEDDFRKSLFGPEPDAEAVFAYYENGGDGDSEPVGLAVFCQRYSTYLGRPVLYLEDIFVLPEWRGGGVGRELMAYGAGLAKAREFPMMIWSVLDWNEPAIGFYENLGAQRAEGWVTYQISGDALKRLGPTD